MIIDVLTLFPEIIQGVLCQSVTGRALKNNLFTLNLINIRDFAGNKHNRVDDYPYGGGTGMVMQAQPIFDAYEAAIKTGPKPRFIYVTPHGKPYNQALARELAKEERLLFLCGHYEGIDQRVIDRLCPEEISLGDFILTGGELAVLPICDSVLRLLPGVLGNEESTCEESFEQGLLEYPQYTRPEEVLGSRVPEVLLSGHHKMIEEWRLTQSLRITLEKRPDLLANRSFTKEERRILEKIQKNLD